MEKIYNFSLTEQEANVVMFALGELPAKTSMDVINKMRKQFKEQNEPKPDEENTGD